MTSFYIEKSSHGVWFAPRSSPRGAGIKKVLAMERGVPTERKSILSMGSSMERENEEKALVKRARGGRKICVAREILKNF